jgi:DNA primase
VLPIKDERGEIVSVAGRSIVGSVKLKEFGTHPNLYLYGMHELSQCESTGSIVIVEGYFDVLFLQSNGVPAVGYQGITPTDSQINKLVKHGKKVVFMPDGDVWESKSKKELVMKAFKRLSRYLDVVFFKIDCDPDEISSDQLKTLRGTI